MRIAISGTANTGKTTLIEDFLKRWPTFKTTEGSYRQFLDEGNHSSKTTEEVQNKILEWFIEEQAKYDPTDNIIFDRCSLDNLAYTFWAVHNGKIDSKYADKIIPMVRESLGNLDIIFLVKYDPRIPIQSDGVRDVDPKYIKEVDAIFELMYEDYVKNDENTFLLFPKDNMPALIELYGSREQRIAQIADYVDPFGEVVDTPPQDSVLSEEQLKKMEAFVEMQKQMALEDKWSVS